MRESEARPALKPLGLRMLVWMKESRRRGSPLAAIKEKRKLAGGLAEGWYGGGDPD
jgi:hypothetical protein